MQLNISTITINKPSKVIRILGYYLDHKLSHYPQQLQLIKKLNYDLLRLKLNTKNMLLLQNIHVYRFVMAVSISKIKFGSIMFHSASLHQLRHLQVTYGNQ